MISKSLTIDHVLTRADPADDALPIVFDSPHSGVDYPADFKYACSLEALRQSEDSYVDELYASAPQQGGRLLTAHFPRCYIDPNRAVDDLDPGLLSESWPTPLNPGVKVELGVGLLWRLEPLGGVEIYRRQLSVEEIKHRIDRYYTPYHNELKHMLDDAYTEFGQVWHVNCHSMPSVGSHLSPDGIGAKRPQFCLGDLNGTTCESGFTGMVRERLQKMGYQVALNDPYAGAELVARYADPTQGRHSLQIEINRGLYMNEKTLERNDAFPTLQQNLNLLIQEIVAYVLERIGRQ